MATKKATTTTTAAAGADDGQDLAAEVAQLVTRVDQLANAVWKVGQDLAAVAAAVVDLRQRIHHPERHAGVLDAVPETA